MEAFFSTKLANCLQNTAVKKCTKEQRCVGERKRQCEKGNIINLAKRNWCAEGVEQSHGPGF